MSVQVKDDHRPSTPPSSVELFDLEPRTDLNGLLVQQPGQPAIYLVDLGYKCLLHNLKPFKPNPHITPYDVSTIPTGKEVPPDAALIKAFDSLGVYLVEFAPYPNNGQIVKRPIFTPAIFERYQFDWTKINGAPTIVVLGLPTGPPLEPPSPSLTQS